VRERCSGVLDGIGHVRLTKNCLALSASVQVLSDCEDVERQLLTVPEEDNCLADEEEGHLGPLASATLQTSLNEDIHNIESHNAAFVACAIEPAALMTNNPQSWVKRARGRPKKVGLVLYV